MPTTKQATVVAVFSSASEAQAAANELERNGFDRDDIYVSSDETSSQDAVAQTGYSERERPKQHEGGIKGWFKSIFGSDEDADQETYERAFTSGNAIVSVQTGEDDAERAAEILERHVPVDLHSEAAGSSGATAAGTSVGTRGGVTAPPSGRTTDASAKETGAIPVVEEELQVGKRTVVRGGVRIYSRIVERPVQETVNLREERVRVERQPVNRPVSESDLQAGRDQVIEVKEYAEEPVVSKQARVVEEVRVSKDADERTESVRDKVRHTEVNVEDLSRETETAAGGGVDYSDDFRRHFTSTYGSAGSYEDYEPAYRYGYNMANDPRYRGRNFSEIESELRDDYARRYPTSTWEKMKDSIRYGWDRVTGRAKSATTNR